MKTKIHKIVDDGLGYLCVGERKVGRLMDDWFFCEKDFKKHYFRRYMGFGLSLGILNFLNNVPDLKGIRLNVKYEDKEEIWETELRTFIGNMQIVQFYPYEEQGILNKKYWRIK